MKAQDVFTDDMHVCGPKFFIEYIVLSPETQCGHIISKCVTPNIHYLALVTRNGYSDRIFLACPRKTDILQPLVEKRKNFIPAGFWNNSEFAPFDFFFYGPGIL